MNDNTLAALIAVLGFVLLLVFGLKSCGMDVRRVDQAHEVQMECLRHHTVDECRGLR